MKVLLPLPPQRMPSRVTLLLLVLGWRNTGDPLSPPATPAETTVWQSWVTLLPDTFTLTQVAVIPPRVHPVVLPTLFAVCPTTGFPSAVTEKLPEIVNELLLGPVVWAIAPSVAAVLFT